jgi:hypothetical protein
LRLVGGARECTVRTTTLAAPFGKSPAIAILRRRCGGARGRDRTLWLPVIRLRPRTFLQALSFRPVFPESQGGQDRDDSEKNKG